MPTPKQLRYFEPSAATASMFLYAQGAAIVCCHHDTLTIERRFAKHSEEIQLLAVDNQSDKGAGRLVVSYDAGQTAIVWDLMTGDEVSRFSSYEDLTVAAWMRSGNVAFGKYSGLEKRYRSNSLTIAQVIPRATLSCSNPPLQSTFRQERWIRLL
jgi:hypothetical protein